MSEKLLTIVIVATSSNSAWAIKAITNFAKMQDRKLFYITLIAKNITSKLRFLFLKLNNDLLIDRIFFVENDYPTEVSLANIAWKMIPTKLYMWLPHGLIPKTTSFVSQILKEWRGGLAVSVYAFLDAATKDTKCLIIQESVVELLGFWNEDYISYSAAVKDYINRLHCANFPVYSEPSSDYFVNTVSDEFQEKKFSSDSTLLILNDYLYELCIRSWKMDVRNLVQEKEDHSLTISEKEISKDLKDLMTEYISIVLSPQKNTLRALTDTEIEEAKARFAALDSACQDLHDIQGQEKKSHRDWKCSQVSSGKNGTVFSNAVIMPFQGNMDAFASGVFVDGKCESASLMARGVAAPFSPPQTYISEPCIFGGYLFAHYGHFIVESLSRYYAYSTCAPLPLLFVTPNTGLKYWQKQIFSLLGIQNKILFIKVPTQVSELFLAPADGDFNKPMSQKQLSALGRISYHKQKPGKKVWISRNLIRLGSRIVEEELLEQMLAQEGWEIVHPEHLPVALQLRAFMEAEYLAGFDGSAFYTLLFAKSIQSTVILFSRRNAFVPIMLDYIKAKGATLYTYMPIAKVENPKEEITNFSIDIKYIINKIHDIVP